MAHLRKKLLTFSLVVSLIGILTSFSPLAFAAPPAIAGDLAVVRDRMVQDFLSRQVNEADARKLVSTLRPDGSWPDVDYASQSRSAWTTASHISRVLALVVAYRKPGQSLQNDASVHAALHSSLDYWLANDFQSANWWWNQISVPGTLGEILLLLSDDATADERAKSEPILSRAKFGMTGQNRVWMAQNELQHGLLLGDDARIRKAVSEMLAELAVTADEGIQVDGSFHQHGPQQQFGNYGLAFAGTETHWAGLLRGTEFAPSKDQLGALALFLLEGERWVMWKDKMDISGLGRQIARGAPLARGKSLSAAFRTMETVDPADTSAYEQYLAYFKPNPPAQNSLVGNHPFWRSDMIVHRTPEFYTSVRMSSARVMIDESINSENLLGNLLGDGATYVYRTGDEYDDIFAAWDWHRIPGVTSYSVDPLPSFRVRNSSGFVGEVSNGKTGASAMDFSRAGLTARKSWFFFDNGFMCLGAGINSGDPRDVTTTINQCLLNGNVLVSSDGRTSAPVRQGSETVHHPAWVLHDSIGYCFPVPTDVALSAQNQSGAWKSIALSQSSETVTLPVFAIGIDHGAAPQGATYAYTVLPGATASSLAAFSTSPPFAVVSNTPALQGVETSNHDEAMAVFYMPGTLQPAALPRIGVSQPCLLIALRQASTLNLTLSAPTEKLTSLTLRVSGHFSAPGATYDTGANETAVSVAFPTGQDAGKSVAVALLPIQ